MSDHNLNFEVLKAINDILRQNRKDPELSHEKLTVYISQLLAKGAGVSRSFILQHTIDALGLLGRFDEAEVLLKELLALDVNSVESLICASTFYRMHKRDAMKAVEMAEAAVGVALAAGNSVVHSYEELCRAAKDASNYELLERSLDKAIDYKVGELSRDIMLADDLLDDVPKGMINAQLIERYQSWVSPD